MGPGVFLYTMMKMSELVYLLKEFRYWTGTWQKVNKKKNKNNKSAKKNVKFWRTEDKDNFKYKARSGLLEQL